MKKIKLIICAFFLLLVSFLQAQTIELDGKVSAKDDLENIHVLNKTSLTNTTTDKNGNFKIKVKLKDTIVFSAVQYQLLVKVVSKEDISAKKIEVILEMFTNELDEVYVTKQLSGNLTDDVSSSNAKPTINFYDVGIPGYKGKRKTQSERRLHEAGELNTKEVLVGMLSGGIPLNPILNAITGRTKELKERVRLENNDALLARLKNNLSEGFFKDYPLETKYHTEFFYFVQEDENFRARCSKSDLDALTFFKEKLIKFKENLKTKE